MTPSSLPFVRLMPKADVRAIRHGFPWVYSNEVVLDRRTKNLAPGSIVMLQDAERRDLAIATINPNSKITCRVFDRDPGIQIDRNWLMERIRTALAHRERLYDTPFYRLIHAEADGFPGVIVD